MQDVTLGQHSKLYAFGDTSEVAYTTAVYLRAIVEDGKATISLVMSKKRVAPLRKIVLPRYEVMAAPIKSYSRLSY